MGRVMYIKRSRISGSRHLLHFAVLLSLAFSISAFGQETTGTIDGTVTDSTGASVPEASVTVSASGLVRENTTTTNTNGYFKFASLPPGSYTVTVTKTGFSTTKKAGLNVQLGRTLTANIALQVGQIAETVIVSAEAVAVDTQSSASAVTVDKSFFDLIPKGRSFYDLIAIAPGARNESKAGGYEIDGASGSENTFYLDGMEVTGIQTGTLSDQARIPNEMVQQVEIKNGVMEAQYGGAMGGVVNAVVRSGTNGFHGQLGFFWNGDALQARPRPELRLNPYDADELTAEHFLPAQDSFNTWNPVFNIAGPLIKNKLFFFSAYEPSTTSTTRNVNFITSKPGVFDTGTYQSTYTQHYLANKVDYAPFEKLRINTSWIWNPNKNTGYLPSRQGTDAFTSPWGQRGDRTSGNILSGEVTYLATSNLVFSFRGGYHYTNFNNNYGIPSTTAVYYSNSNAGIAGVPADLVGSAGWRVQAVGFTQHDTYTRENYNADVSYVFNAAGQHSLKAGWQMNELGNSVFKSDYPYGYYRYYWNSTYKCVTSQCTSGKGAYGYYRYRVLGTFGDVSSNNQGLFLQDNWKVNRRLTLNLGLRTEREYVPSFSANKSLPSEAITFSWPEKFSPRLGFALDPTGTGKQKVYASFGIFYDIMKYELPRGSFGGDVWKEYYYTLDDPTLVAKNQGYAANPTGLPGKLLEQIDWRVPSNDPSQHLIDPNLKPVKQRMIDVGYERSIGASMVGSVRYTNRRLLRTIEDTGYIDQEAGETYLIANPGEGVTADPKNWLKWMGPGIPVTPKPVRKYDAVEFRFDKRFSSHYQFAASYTWSRLWGNYSGLASSDEDGRNSPNVNRYYDQPWVGVTEKGTYAYGPLATDRPHTLKFFGGYTLNSRLGRTTLSPNIQWYSGVPITTQANLVSTTPAFPYGRGDMGRTPVFFNTDLNLVHEILPFSSRESVRIRFEFTVFNLFNNDTVTNVYTTLVHPDYGNVQFQDANGDPTYADIFKGFNTKALMTAQELPVDPRYGWANGFQSPRWARLQLSFIF